MSAEKKLLRDLNKFVDEYNLPKGQVGYLTGLATRYAAELEHTKQSKQEEDNGLRKAAEKVVYEWHNSVGEECIDAAMVELVKALNQNK